MAVLATTGALAAPLILSVSSRGAAPPAADTVFLNGKVLRYADHSRPEAGFERWSQAVAVQDGKIVYVGGDAGAREYIGPDTQVLDVDERMVMPGIVDGHWHGQGFTVCDMGYVGAPSTRSSAS